MRWSDDVNRLIDSCLKSMIIPIGGRGSCEFSLKLGAIDARVADARTDSLCGSCEFSRCLVLAYT